MATEPNIPPAAWQNDDGACWSCLRRNRTCDLALPRCRNCAERGIRCRGFGVKLRWPVEVFRNRRKPRPRPTLDGSSQGRGGRDGSVSHGPERTSTPGQPSLSQTLSSLGLPAEDSYFMQHFLQNIARVALAIDYEGNGYRSLLPLAAQDRGVMNAALAVASSHHSRWQRTSDEKSREYLRTAATALRDRFANARDLNSPVTLATMLLMVSFEVFSGSPRWKGHMEGVRGWIRSRRDCSDLDPFLKTLVCLVETQCALNMGSSFIPELEFWMNVDPGPVATGDSIDAVFGCSTKLPKLMWAASQLQSASKDPSIPTEEIRQRAEILQKEIRATEIQPDSEPNVVILCHGTRKTYSATVGLDEEDLRRRMVATAEIFRHASHIYVHRITHSPEEPLTAEMEASLRTALQLLTQVPDAIGPGANLGWCMVVIGAELDLLDQRDYIRSRWCGMHLLGIYNSKSGERILEETWNHRDLVHSEHAMPARWQDIMQRMGESQILV